MIDLRPSYPFNNQINHSAQYFLKKSPSKRTYLCHTPIVPSNSPRTNMLPDHGNIPVYFSSPKTIMND